MVRPNKNFRAVAATANEKEEGENFFLPFVSGVKVIAPKTGNHVSLEPKQTRALDRSKFGPGQISFRVFFLFSPKNKKIKNMTGFSTSRRFSHSQINNWLRKEIKLDVIVKVATLSFLYMGPTERTNEREKGAKIKRSCGNAHTAAF